MKNITVVGAGTMGTGIAHVFAQFGHVVKLVDLNEDVLSLALKTISQNMTRQVKKDILSDEDMNLALARITTHTNLAEATSGPDLAIEASSENLNTKLALFKELDRLCPPSTILATNTSSISITKIASATKRPEKVIGMHFMNPVPVMKLIEVIKGYSTNIETCQAILELSKQIDKVPVEVNDYPGFISNRILMPMINEAIYSLHENVAGVQQIDEIMKLGMSHPMGPLQLADFIGLDVCLSILYVLFNGFGNQKYAPCPLLVNMVEAGKLGRKSGEGFYCWTSGSKEIFVSPRFNK